MNTKLIIALGMLLLSPFGFLQAQPGPGWRFIGEDTLKSYYMKESDYKGSPVETSTKAFCRAKLQVAADQLAIKKLSFDVDADRYELFTDVAKEQKAELQKRVFDALFDHGLELAGAVVDKGKSLNPWNVNKAIKMLDQKGFKNKLIADALRAIAHTKDKPAMAKAFHEFAEEAKKVKERVDTLQDLSDDSTEAKLTLLVSALEIMQGNEELGLVVTTAEFTESIVYLCYLSGKVEDLSRQTSDKLLRLSSLSKRLQGHVGEMIAAKKTWQNATKHPGAWPVCGD